MNEQRRVSPRRDEGPGTREALLVAARRCVAEHGLRGASSRRIAAEAGANLASITYYFGSKDDLLADALLGEVERRLAPVLDALEGEGLAPQRLLGAVQALTVELDRSQAEVPVFLHALVSLPQDDAFATRGRALFDRLADRLAAVIAELQERGEIASWVEPGAMASLIIAASNGVALQTQLQPGGPTPGAMATQFAQLLLGAAAPPPRRARH